MRNSLIMCAAIIFQLAIPTTAQEFDAATHFAGIARAAELYSQKDFKPAAELYAALASEDPQNGALFVRLGRSLQRAGDLEKAIQAYDQATTLGFGNSDISIDAASACAELARDPCALDWLKRALDQRVDGRTELASNPAFTRLLHVSRFRTLVGLPPERALSRTEQWQFDLHLLDEEAKRLHASFRREAFSDQWNGALKDLVSKIASLTDTELILGVRRLVVLLNDGHSSALPPWPLQMAQVDLYVFDDGVYIIGGEGEVQRAIGSRVLAIGGKPIRELEEEIRAYQPHDNTNMYKWGFPVYITDPDLLKSLGAMKKEDSAATLTVIDAQGRRSDVHAIVSDNWQEKKLFPSAISSNPVPLYLQHVSDNFWFTNLPELRSTYVQLNQLWRTPGKSFEEIADDLFYELTADKSQNLILDLRHNNGGNSFLGRSLIHTLVWFEQTDKAHRIFVITSRNTFSAAQILISQLEQQTSPIFVGEPSSSSPNFTGEDGERFILPFSRIKVNISFKRHQVSMFDDNRPWIPVSVPTPLKAKDYFDNRDPSMEAITRIIIGR